jgi:hypothetical protein
MKAHDRAPKSVSPLARLRERVGERVSPQRDNPQAERALTRAFGATSPASRRGLGARGAIVCLTILLKT